jgi:hypothetical protein
MGMGAKILDFGFGILDLNFDYYDGRVFQKNVRDLPQRIVNEPPGI